MKRILTLLVLFTWGLSAQAAAPGYSLTATTRIYRGEPAVLVDEDTHTGLVPVSAAGSHIEGGTTATADANANFNDLHVRSFSAGTNSSSTQLTSISVAEWSDRLFFKRNGQDIVSGDLAATVHVKGLIDFQPPFPSQWLMLTVSFGGAGGGVGLGLNGPYDKSYTTNSLNRTWNATDGLALHFQLAASAYNSPTVLSALTDFSGGAQITNISLLGPNGQPDPTVNITSSSGIVYGIPEPPTFLLAIGWLGAAVHFRRSRTSRAIA